MALAHPLVAAAPIFCFHGGLGTLWHGSSHTLSVRNELKSKNRDFPWERRTGNARLVDMVGLHEKDILETLIALLAQCDELLNDLEQYSPKYDELIRATRAAYRNALSVYVAD